jgi:hypothetical protein
VAGNVSRVNFCGAMLCGLVNSTEVKTAGSSKTLVLSHYMTSHPSCAVLYRMAELPWFLNIRIVDIRVLNCDLFVTVWSPVAMCT